MSSLINVLNSFVLVIVLGSLTTIKAKDARQKYALDSGATRHKALCSSYSDFKPCEAFVYRDFRITANLPKDYLDVDSKSLLKIEICDADAICKTLAKENLSYVWVDSYISPFTAVVDFKVRYKADISRPKTAILRFYNRRAASNFGKAIICAYNNQLFQRSANSTINSIDRNNDFSKNECWK